MANPPVIEIDKYQLLLEKLLAEGKGYGRKGEIVAIPLPDGKNFYVTENIQKGLELQRSGRIPDASDTDVYVRKKGVINNDYQPADAANPKNGRLKPKPESHRVVLRLEQEATIPVMWDLKDGFHVAAGDYIVAQQKDITALGEAIDAIKQGTKTPADALYIFSASDGKTNLKFDIYGMPASMLGPLGYNPVDLSDDTKAIAARFGQAAAKAAAFAALPFTRKSSNFIADHVAPERATFKRRFRSGQVLS